MGEGPHAICKFSFSVEKEEAKEWIGEIRKIRMVLLKNICWGGGEGMIGIEISPMSRVEVLLWFCWMQKGGNAEQMSGKSQGCKKTKEKVQPVW
jgi:hypothetical protein